MSFLSGYIGTYSKNNSKGIYYFEIDKSTDKISTLQLAGEINNPTYLIKNKSYLYSICSEMINGELYGGVASFKIKKDNNLNLIDKALVKGKAPCHITINNNSTILFSCNYHENRILSCKIKEGIFLNQIDEINHLCNSPLDPPQDKPHIHYVGLSNNEKKLYTLDLGINALNTYKNNDGNLSFIKDKSLTFDIGTGPRHLILSKEEEFIYVISEISGEIFKIDNSDNSLKIIDQIKLSDNLKTPMEGAAIRIHPNNKFLYASERVENKIHLVHIDKGFNKTFSYSSYGNGPRDFNISTDGNYLLCGNQITNNIVLFKINKETGELKFCHEAPCPSPVCVLFN